MAKDLTLNVVAKKDSRQLEELAAEFDALNKKVDDNSKSLQKNASFSKLLDDRIAATKKQVHDLGVEAEKTGNVDVFRNLRNAEKNLAGLERLRKQLSTALDIKVNVGGNQNNGGFFSNFGSSLKNLVTGAGLQGTKAGDAFGKGFIGTVGEVVSAAGPVLIPAAVLLADELVAVAGAAITAGIGGAGLAAGIAGAFQDPQVKQAASGLGATLKGTLTEVGKDFVGPVEQALSRLTSAAQVGSADVAKAFEPLTRAIGPIEKGIEGFVSSALPGLTKAFKDAEPVLEEVGKQLPGLGRAIGDSISKIASNVNENKAAIQLTFQLIDKTIEGLGTLISTSEKVFGGMVRAIEPVAVALDDTVGALERLIGHIPFAGAPFKFLGDAIHGAREQTGDLNHTLNEHKGVQGIAAAAISGTNTALSDQAAKAKIAAGDLSALSGVLNKTTDTADTLAGAMSDKVLGSLLAGDHAVLGFQESLTNLNDSFAQNGKQLDITTAKGQANREAVLAVIAANIQQYDANIAAGDSAQEAASKYDASTEALRRQLTQAGLTKDQIDGLIGKYAQVPDKVNTNIALEGLTDALNNVAILIGAINGIPKYVKIEAAIEAVDKSGLAQNVPNKHRASGGPVTAGQAYIVGEKRPELFVPNVNGTIIPKIPAPTPYLTSSAARGSSAPPGGGWGLQVLPGGDALTAQYLHALVDHGVLQLVRSR